MAIAAGQLDRRILIQRRVVTQNETGEEVAGWMDVFKLWAEYLPLGGGDEFKADQRSSKQRANFRIRYVAGLDATMRVVFDGETYQIDAIDEPERRIELVLSTYVREVTAGP